MLNRRQGGESQRSKPELSKRFRFTIVGAEIYETPLYEVSCNSCSFQAWTQSGKLLKIVVDIHLKHCPKSNQLAFAALKSSAG